MLVAADAAAQLMQIGQAVAIGLVDEDRVGVGNVQPALDDRRGQQHVEAVVDEIDHHLFQLALGHLAVADGDAGLGHDLPQVGWPPFRCRGRGCGRKRSARRDSIRARSAWRISSGSNRVTRVSTARRSSGGVSRFEMSRTPSSDMCSVRGMGVAVIVSTSIVCRRALSRSFTSTPNRCSSSMTSRPRLSKWTSCWASRCVPMTMSTAADRRAPSSTRFCWVGGAEPRQGGDGERKGGHPVAERAQMLLGQDRGRHQHGHLVAGVDRLERGPHGHFGLAEADVAAEQPVHRPRLRACRA